MSFGGIDLNLIGWGLIAVFGLFGAILGFCRGLGRTLWRILFVSVSVVASYFTARLLSRTLVRFFASRIDRYISGGNLLEVLDELSENYPKTYELASAIVSAVGAIPLFLVVFAAMSLIFFIGYIIVRFVACRNKPKMILRLPAALIGALGGVLVFLIFISPLSCTSVFVTEHVERVENLGDLEEVTEIAGQINDVNVIKASSSAPFMVLFDHLTTYRIGSASSNIRTDVDLVFDVIENVQPLLGVKAANFDEPQVEAVSNLMALASGSDIFTNVYAEFISVSAQRYIDGKTVFGSSYEQLRNDLAILQSLDPIPDELLVILSETTPKNAGDDYTFISEEFSALVRRGVLRMDEETAKRIFSDSATLRELLCPLFASERTRSVASAVLLAGINYVSDTVELPENSTEAYRNLAVSACRAAAASGGQAGASLQNVLNKYMMNVGPAAEVIASALSGVSEDAPDLTQRFAAAVEAALNDRSLSLTKDQKKDLKSLVSSSEFGSRCVTKYSLLQSIRDAKTEKMKNSAEEEADCLVGAVNSFISFGKSIPLSGRGISLSRTSLQHLGDGLVMLKKADSVPDSLPGDLAAGFFQTLGLSTAGFDLSGFVTLLTDSIRKDDDGEAVRNVMDSIAAAYSLANTLTSGGKASAEDIASLISSADETTLTSLRSSLDTEFFEVQGLRSDRAEKISTALDVVLAKTGERERKTGEKLEAEADSLTTMMDMVSTLNSSDHAVFDTREEADRFVSAYLDSEICREAVKELVKGEGDTTVRDPLGLSQAMDAVSVSNLAAAAQAAANGNADIAALLAFIGR